MHFLSQWALGSETEVSLIWLFFWVLSKTKAVIYYDFDTNWIFFICFYFYFFMLRPFCMILSSFGILIWIFAGKWIILFINQLLEYRYVHVQFYFYLISPAHFFVPNTKYALHGFITCHFHLPFVIHSWKFHCFTLPFFCWSWKLVH